MGWYFWLLAGLFFLNGIACLLSILWVCIYYPLKWLVRRRRKKMIA